MVAHRESIKMLVDKVNNMEEHIMLIEKDKLSVEKKANHAKNDAKKWQEKAHQSELCSFAKTQVEIPLCARFLFVNIVLVVWSPQRTIYAKMILWARIDGMSSAGNGCRPFRTFMLRR